MSAYEGSKMQEQRQDHFGTPVDHHGYTIKSDTDQRRQDYQGIGTDSWRQQIGQKTIDAPKPSVDVVSMLLRDSPTDTLLSLFEHLPAELEKRRVVASREEARILSALYPPPKDEPVAPEKVIGNPSWMRPQLSSKDKPVTPEEVIGAGSPSHACNCSSCQFVLRQAPETMLDYRDELRAR